MSEKVATLYHGIKLKVSFLYSLLHTIKHSKAVLGGGRQGLAGGVQLVTIVPNADLKLNWLTRLLEHARTVEHGAHRVLPPPLVFLPSVKRMWQSQRTSRKFFFSFLLYDSLARIMKLKY